MFRSTWTIIRDPKPNLAEVTILWKQSVKIQRYMFSNVVVKSVSSCGVYWVPCSVWLSHTLHTALNTQSHNAHRTQYTVTQCIPHSIHSHTLHTALNTQSYTERHSIHSHTIHTALNTQSHATRHSVHTKAWNTFYHNIAEHITMYFYW
jgi:hypothetical protein